MAVKPNIDYTSKDYEAFRNDMIDLIPQKLPEYTDFSESDAGIMLIELIAYVGDILSYYQDRQANEVYLPTATKRKSVIDITKMLGYRLKNAVPSSSKVVFTLVDRFNYDILIPRGTPVSTEGTEYEEPIQFETVADLVIPAGALGNETDEEGNYLYAVDVIQGITIRSEIIGSSNGLPLQRFPLQFGDVIDGSVQVEIDEGAGFELWTDMTDDPIGSTNDGKFFKREIDEYGITWIVFGDGLNGKIPAVGQDNIRATYRVGGGAHTNVGANTITTLLDPIAEVASVTNIIPATGGLDAETLAQVKRNAPKLFKTQSRAVTREDYEAIALSVPGVAKARAVADADKARNTVHVTIAPNGGGLPSDKLINDVYQLLDDVKVITTSIVMEMPKYVMARVSLDVELQENANQEEVRTFIIETLKDLFDFSQREFGQGTPVSQVYHDVMKIDGVYSVTVTRFTTNPLVEWKIVSGNPTLSTIEVLPGATYKGEWKVVLDSATTFTVYQVSYDTNGDEILTPQGSGTFGTKFTSNDGSIRFTINEGTVACAKGDTFRFKTLPYLGNLEVDEYELLLLDEEDLQINITGGVAQ